MDTIQLTDVTPFPPNQDGELINVVVDWVEDDAPQVVGEVYTICVALHVGAENGPEKCSSFGPFF